MFFVFLRDSFNYHLKKEPTLKAINGPQLRGPKVLERGTLAITSLCSFNIYTQLWDELALVKCLLNADVVSSVLDTRNLVSVTRIVIWKIVSTENAGLCVIDVQCSFCKVSEKKKVYLLGADNQYLTYGREKVCGL